MVRISKMMVKLMVMKGSLTSVGLKHEGVLPMDKVEAFNELESSIVPFEGILICLYHTMQEITKECTQGRVAFCDIATLFITTTNHGF
jgi:hypothetical protein